MKILVLDNYDSFVYNIVQVVREMDGVEVDVRRNDKIGIDEVAGYDKLILSPGPGIPSEAGILLEVIKRYAGKKPMLGVCLGEQAIGEAFGGRLLNLSEVYHGVATPIRKVAEDYVFDSLDETFVAGRYHSWVVEESSLPACLEVTAKSEDGNVMGIRHKEYDIHGVQFHPESVLTPKGATIIQNFIRK